MRCVIALAGRRIDAPDAETPRFPLAAVPFVREQLDALFADRGATALVCSAACGADLVALDAATELGLRCRGRAAVRARALPRDLGHRPAK
jgi:hypothetical protein